MPRISRDRKRSNQPNSKPRHVTVILKGLVFELPPPKACQKPKDFDCRDVQPHLDTVHRAVTRGLYAHG